MERNWDLAQSAARRQGGRCSECGRVFLTERIRVRLVVDRWTRERRLVCSPKCAAPRRLPADPGLTGRDLEIAVFELAARHPELVAYGPRPVPPRRGRGRPRRVSLERYASMRIWSTEWGLRKLGREPTAPERAWFHVLPKRTVQRWEAELRRRRSGGSR